MKKRGALYEKAKLPFVPYVVVDENLVTGQNLGSAKETAEKVAARAAGQASGVAHMGAHALGAAAHAARAADLAATDQEAARLDEVRWQLNRMTVDVRAALARLPPLGENASGPLGSGLLASGVLATTIREIQVELSGSVTTDRPDQAPS